MSITRLNPECITCLLNKYLNKVPDGTDEATKLAYMQGVLKILAETPKEISAPQAMSKITRLQKELLGYNEDFTDRKKYYNRLMLSYEEEINENIKNSKEPLRLALNYALLGNYIDFGAMNSVDENKLKEMLQDAKTLSYKDEEFSNLKKDLCSLENLVYITDNCGEILLDKLFIKTVLSEYPNIKIQVIVRGAPVLNDATIEDAYEIGLNNVAPVMNNGTSVAGTCLDEISKEARKTIENADLIISKGQANFETLRFSNKNIYYIFMCKCKMFADRFNVPPYSGMLLNDLRM